MKTAAERSGILLAFWYPNPGKDSRTEFWEFSFEPVLVEAAHPKEVPPPPRGHALAVL
jgi:hypothetical protein